jgi:hypothetical protein
MLHKEDIIKLTVAVYQVTENFPENEALRFQIRQKANNILADFICLEMNPGKKESVKREIEVLRAYFSITESQNWVNNKNFLVLRQEYGKITDFIDNLSDNPIKSIKKSEVIVEKINNPQRVVEKKKESRVINRASSNPSVRQKQILELLKAKNQLSLIEIKDMFSSLSSRTLRRDLSALVSRSIIDRIRQGRDDVLYVLK